VSEHARILGLIDEAVMAGVHAQLGSFGYVPSDGGPSEVRGERSYSASLGYTSVDVRGVLVVLGPAALWSAIYTVLVGQPPPAALSAEELCDVAGEFANVAVGRLKRALLAEGVEVGLAVPSGTSGFDLRSETLGKGAEPHVIHLHTSDGVLTVSNSALVDAGIVLGEKTPSAAPIGGEGELFVF
jgi:hypothetical protein